jgi:anion-transporting  ArsA/GET3 family ATPase
VRTLVFVTASVTTGLFTLGGVLIGGSANAVLGLLTEHRQRRHVAKTNARLLADDVRSAQRAVRRTIDKSRLVPLRRRMNTIDGYEERRDQLAATLRSGEWAVVSRAFRNLSELLIFVSEQQSDDVDAAGLVWLQVLYDELDQAGRILAAVGGQDAALVGS